MSDGLSSLSMPQSQRFDVMQNRAACNGQCTMTRRPLSLKLPANSEGVNVLRIRAATSDNKAQCLKTPCRWDLLATTKVRCGAKPGSPRRYAQCHYALIADPIPTTLKGKCAANLGGPHEQGQDGCRAATWLSRTPKQSKGVGSE